MADIFGEFEEMDNSIDSANAEDPSLTSILAEVKGSAYINGDKKTPPDLLQEKADRILREAAAMSGSAQMHHEKPKPSILDVYQTASADIRKQSSQKPQQSQTPKLQQADEAGHIDPGFSVADFYEDEYLDADTAPIIVTPAENAPNASTSQTQSATQFSAAFGDALGRQDTVIHRSADTVQLQGESVTLFDFDKESPSIFSEPEQETTSEDEDFVEPDLKKLVKRFAADCNSVSLRVIPAAVITLLMIMMTYVFEAGLIMPFGIRHSLHHTAGVLVILLLMVMILCSDILIRGVNFLIRGAPNAETLILFSCVFSVVSAAFTMLTDSAQLLPFGAVSAMSLTLAAFGEKYNLRAITETLKTAVGTSEPFGVQSEYNTKLDKSVLKKTYNRTDGFYTNFIGPDITETLYRFAAPALLIGALLLSILTIALSGEAGNAFHILSALFAAAAPFSLLLSFSLPYATVAKTARKSGAAIAGWGGADDIYNSDGVSITDDDLFPPGMLRLSGFKVYDGASPEAAIRYTASLIITSGSGLTSLYSEILKQQGVSMLRVDNFECHESGIAGVINGDTVCTGSGAFMNLQGVRVPDDTSMKNAVYTSVNGRLSAMFAVDYKPLPSVQNALISMIRWRIDLFFAMRDFNVTPAMVGQKFKVPFDSFVFIPAKESYTISDMHSGSEGRMAAVLARDGLGPFAEAITGGRLLRAASLFATVLSIASAALGVLIMFYMTWTGSFESARPGNLLIFMLCMLATVLIVCGYVRLKK